MFFKCFFQGWTVGPVFAWSCGDVTLCRGMSKITFDDDVAGEFLCNRCQIPQAFHFPPRDSGGNVSLKTSMDSKYFEINCLNFHSLHRDDSECIPWWSGLSDSLEVK